MENGVPPLLLVKTLFDAYYGMIASVSAKVHLIIAVDDKYLDGKDYLIPHLFGDAHHSYLMLNIGPNACRSLIKDDTGIVVDIRLGGTPRLVDVPWNVMVGLSIAGESTIYPLHHHLLHDFKAGYCLSHAFMYSTGMREDRYLPQNEHRHVDGPTAAEAQVKQDLETSVAKTAKPRDRSHLKVVK